MKYLIWKHSDYVVIMPKMHVPLIRLKFLRQVADLSLLNTDFI